MSDAPLKAQLEQVADLAGGQFTPPDTARFAARRRARRRVTASIAGAVAAVVVVATATTLLTGSAHHPAREVRSASLPVPNVQTAPGRVSAAELTRYRWSELPDAPIPTRSEGIAAVWTGSAMLIWGGESSHGQAYSDGAGYDPRSRTWTKLASSPLAPRSNPAYTWTGRAMFIWGGTGQGRSTTMSDGALYDPAAQSWRQLPPLRIHDDADPTAVWTGSRVVLLTTAPGAHATTIDAHAYDPTSDSWTTLPSIRIAQTNLLGISAVVAGTQLYVWAPVQTTISGAGLRTGNDAFRYRPASNTWATSTLLPAQKQFSVGNAMWTGDHIIFEPNGLECSCGGIAGASTGSWADPRTGQVTNVPAWQPGPFTSSTFSWTGNAILAAANARAAAWNPATQRWTDLRPAPFQGGAVQIWTGNELLIWGQLAAPPSTEPGSGSARQVKKPTGLELTHG